MQVILSDHNCEGQSQSIFDVFILAGSWLELIPMRLCWFHEVGLSIKADDETVWRFCQEHHYLLLTGNRRTDDGHQSLEYTIRRLVTPTSLPVVTISNLRRVQPDATYREQCAERLADIVANLEDYYGVTRLYIP